MSGIFKPAVAWCCNKWWAIWAYLVNEKPQPARTQWKCLLIVLLFNDKNLQTEREYTIFIITFFYTGLWNYCYFICRVSLTLHTYPNDSRPNCRRTEILPWWSRCRGNAWNGLGAVRRCRWRKSIWADGNGSVKRHLRWCTCTNCRDNRNGIPRNNVVPE